MASELERYQARQREEERRARTDPRADAYRAGYELMLRQAEMEQQGQTKHETRQRRSVHVISETEYILTEETITTDTFTYGNNVF